jgi:hypothetical protein
MRCRLRWWTARMSDSIVLRTLWYILLIILTVLSYQGEVPFVYAKF